MEEITPATVIIPVKHGDHEQYIVRNHISKSVVVCVHHLIVFYQRVVLLAQRSNSFK